MNHLKILHRMSTGIVILGMALCVPAVMPAQDTAPPQASPGHHSMQGRHRMKSPTQRLQRLTQMLNLTEDQQHQMLPILEGQQKKMDAIRQQMRDSMMDTNQKLEAIMTDSQKQKYRQEMQQRRQSMGRMGRGMGHMGQGMGHMGQGGPGGKAAPPPQQ